MIKKFQYIDYLRAQQIWMVLVCRVMNDKQTIAYGELGRMVGLSHFGVISPLGIIGEHCKYHNLPCINVMVVRKSTRRPGDGVITRPGMTAEQEHKEVMMKDWYNVPRL